MNNRTISILLIEDSPTDALLMRHHLQGVQEYNFAIEEAASLTMATSKAESLSFDAVVLDLGLPESTGLSTFKKAKKSFPDKPIVVVTGDNDRTTLAATMEAGADNYLIKDALEGNRIAIAILSAIRNHQS
ncbi:MAG: response regulator [Cyanobacteria bacterium SZAS-4]|nr:response regulator [Cyanobacteria bacterium SZAS-4]